MPKSKTVEIKKSNTGPKTIGKYSVLGKISQGGMGAILKAKHPTLNKYIILKQLIIKKSASVIERFRREASLMLDLRSEHIVQVYDHFKENSSYFIAMEYVDGISLEKLIEDKRHLSNDAALLILSEVCKAIKYAHDREVIHRDIKPANILISREGEVKLGDFGIAKSMEKNAVDLTKAGSALGSPAYIPPEQIFDIQNADKTADIYALGVTLYQMTTGRLPFPCDFNPQTVYQIKKGKYLPPKKINPRVKGLFQKIISKSVHPNKKKRFKSVDMIISLLDRHLKNYTSQEAINETIKNYIRGKEITLSKASPVKSKVKIKKDNKKIVFPKKLLYIAGIMAVLPAVFYFSGMYYEFVGNKNYGAFKINVKTGSKDFFNFKDDIKAIIYENTAKGYREIKNINLKKNRSSKFSEYSSGKMYLKSNQYRVYINFQNQNYESDIFIEPRIIQVSDPMKKKYDLLDISVSDFQNLPVSFNFDFKDVNTGKPVTNVNINILISGKWIGYFEYLKSHRNSLVSGKEYSFLFNKAGYRRKEYKVDANPYETVINAGIILVPQNGTLLIKSNSNDVKVLIDNSEYYYSYSDDKELKKIQPSIPEVLFNRVLFFITGGEKGKFAKVRKNYFENTDLSILPGNYEITAKVSGVKEKLNIKVYENRTSVININFDKTKKTLKLVH